MDREAFLARVRRATETAVLPDVEASDPGPIPLDGDLFALWESKAAEIGVEVHHVPTANDARELARSLAESSGATTFCSWSDEHLPIHGIDAYLRTSGLDEVVIDLPGGSRGAVADSLGRVDFGVTGADALLAETGSLVLTTGPGRSRFASLLPRTHLAVVTADQVAHSLRAYLGHEPHTANTVVITGPSRTGDIEAVLVQGVHGPAAVHVAVCDA
jgi:L-lactate dehydrogenase complex protein LldG